MHKAGVCHIVLAMVLWMSLIFFFFFFYLDTSCTWGIHFENVIRLPQMLAVDASKLFLEQGAGTADFT